MKKILCMVLALILCIGTAALAEAVPSKTTKDLATVEAIAESGRSILIIIYEDKASDDQLLKLQQAPTKDEYFGSIDKLDGTFVKLSELFENEPVDVAEFASIAVKNYEEADGAVTAKIKFATPYAKDEKVAVLIGLLEDGLNWRVYDGKIIDDQGTIEVVFPGDVMLKLQETPGFIAIANKASAPANPFGSSNGAPGNN